YELELAVVGLGLRVEDPLAAEDLRVLHDHVEQARELVHLAVDHHVEIELGIDDVALEEPLREGPEVHELIAVDHAEPGDPPDALAIAVARRQAGGAQADGERVEEQVAVDLLEPALDHEAADVAADRVALGDHGDVALDRRRTRVETERLALVVGGAGREHAHRDLGRVLRTEDALRDL